MISKPINILYLTDEPEGTSFPNERKQSIDNTWFVVEDDESFTAPIATEEPSPEQIEEVLTHYPPKEVSLITKIRNKISRNIGEAIETPDRKM